MIIFQKLKLLHKTIPISNSKEKVVKSLEYCSSLLPLRYDDGHGAERAQRECPGHRVVRVEHREDPLEELVDHGYLVEVTLTLRWRGIFQ